MHNSINNRLSWRLTYALIIVFVVENVLFIVYHLIEYWGNREELIEDIGEFGILFALNLIALPLMLLLARFLIKRELEPLEQAADTAVRIQGGDLARRIKVDHSPEEIEKLARVFNAAFDRYQSLLDKAHKFNVDASHQLRTPLAIMRATGEVALSKSRDSEEYREVIGSMLEETDHLHKIVTQLLDLAKLSNQSIELSTLNAHQLLERVADRFSAVLEDEPSRVRITGGKDVEFQGAETLLIEALSNLLDNALTHGPSDMPIEMHAARAGSMITLSVIDQGDGIPPADIERLADRFYQIKQGEGTGSGLGLSIVKAIAELHGGALSIDSGKGSGTCVSICFPG